MIAYSEYSSDARIRREAETLATEHKYHVTVIALKETSRPRSYALRRVKVTEVPLRKYRGKSQWRHFMTHCVFAVLALLRCTFILITEGLDVVHVHNMPDFLVFSAALPRLLGRKLVLDIHDSMPETYQGKFRNISRYVYRLLCLEEFLSCAVASNIISVNDIQRNALVSRGISLRKIHVVLNVPDPEIFSFNVAQARNIDRHTATYNIVYHGTVDRMLGVDLAIQAVHRLVDKIPNIHLHILGVGRDLGEFQQLSQKLRLEDHVHFSARLFPLEALPGLLSVMQLGIIPNRRNHATELMLPVKLLEYIAMGIPVVVPRLQTIQYYFTEDMVSYFTPDDVDSMATVIYAIYKDERRSEMQVLRGRKFLEKFGWHEHRRDFLGLYEKL